MRGANSDGEDGVGVDALSLTDGRAEDGVGADERRDDGGALDVGAETRAGTDGSADDGNGLDGRRDSNVDLDFTEGDTALDAGIEIPGFRWNCSKGTCAVSCMP